MKHDNHDSLRHDMTHVGPHDVFDDLLGQSLGHGLGALGKCLELENAHGAIPNDGLCVFDRVGEKLNGLGADIHAHPAIGDSVNGNDLLALGYQGKAIGETLNALLEGVLDETLPNERQALLDRAKQRVANDGISSK